jgi:mycofactocin precursor
MDPTRGDAERDGICESSPEAPQILEEIEVEDLAVDGICGVY